MFEGFSYSLGRGILRSWYAGCRIAPLAGPYGRPETSRFLKVDHYILRVRIMMRLGGCAACSQNTDTDTGEGDGRS